MIRTERKDEDPFCRITTVSPFPNLPSGSNLRLFWVAYSPKVRDTVAAGFFNGLQLLSALI
jgi:hypothetical protein